MVVIPMITDIRILLLMLQIQMVRMMKDIMMVFANAETAIAENAQVLDITANGKYNQI